MTMTPLGWGFLGAIILGIIAWGFYSARKFKEKVPDIFVTTLLSGTLGVLVFVIASLVSLHPTTSIYRIRHVTFVHHGSAGVARLTLTPDATFTLTYAQYPIWYTQIHAGDQLAKVVYHSPFLQHTTWHVLPPSR